MSRALVLAAALAALAALAGACRDPRLEALQAIRGEVCACKTAACAEAAMKRLPAGDVRSDHVAQQVARSMMDCLAKLNERERPSTDPDAEAPAEGASAAAAGSAGSAAPAAASAAPATGSAAPAAGSAATRPAGSAPRPAAKP